MASEGVWVRMKRGSELRARGATLWRLAAYGKAERLRGSDFVVARWAA